jgi:hypothetical protein
MKTLSLVSFLVLLPALLSAQHHSEGMTGNQLLHLCRMTGQETGTVDEVRDYDRCWSYILGSVDAFVMIQHSVNAKTGEANIPRYFCMPDGVDNSQMTRIIKRFLETHPEKLHTGANRLIWDSLVEAFPCK